MNKLIFMDQLFKGNLYLFHPTCKLTPLNDWFTVLKQDLGIFLPLSYDRLSCITQGNLQLLMLAETLSQSSILNCEKIDHDSYHLSLIFLVFHFFDSFCCLFDNVLVISLFYFSQSLKSWINFHHYVQSLHIYIFTSYFLFESAHVNPSECDRRISVYGSTSSFIKRLLIANLSEGSVKFQSKHLVAMASSKRARL